MPAGDLELLVEDRLCRFLGSRARVFAAIEAHRPGVGDRARLLARAAGLARRWPALEPAGKRAILLDLLDGIDLLPESLTIRIPSDRLLALLDEDAVPPAGLPPNVCANRYVSPGTVIGKG